MEDARLEQKVEGIMISKFHLLVGIITICAPIIGFFFKIQLDVALIKQNHEAHMQAALEKIAKMEEDEKEERAILTEQNKQLIILNQLHKKELQ